MSSNPDSLPNIDAGAALSARSARVPHAVFQSSALPAGERFYVWRESVLPLFESIPDDPAETFRARVESFDLRHIFIAMSALSPMRFHRERCHRAAGGPDHLLVQLYLAGGYVGHNGYREVRVRPGDIGLLDLGRELETRAQASRALSVIVPREQVYPYANPARMAHGSVLRHDSALGSILGHHLLTVWRQLPGASAEETERINHLLLSSIVGAFTSTPAAKVGPHERATLEAIRAYIAQNLAEPLTPELLCRRFACSRAQLYRLFQPLGGVAAYVREARLNRCWQELVESNGQPKRIGEVALRWGFTSQSHFNRLFRNAFGIAPGDAVERSRSRGRLQSGPHRQALDRPELHDLLRRL